MSRNTVRKALAVMESNGYVYAEHGKGTFCSNIVGHARKTHNIAVVTTYLSDYIFPRIIKGIDDVLTENGYSIMLKNTKNSRKLEVEFLEELLMKDIDGIILEPSKSQIYCQHQDLFQRFDQLGIPYVFMQGIYDGMEHIPHVLMDDCKGGYLITKYLISLGHRNIYGIFKADDMQGQQRHRGYVQALTEAKISYNPDYVIWFYTEDRFQNPYNHVAAIIKKKEKMDAIVCYNDEIAVTAIRAINDAGLSVPEDISVAGYDNSYIAQNNHLKLTTIAHPMEKIGAQAAKMLLDILDNKPLAEGKEVLLEPKLVIGESCISKY